MIKKKTIEDISIEKKNIAIRIDIDCSYGPEGFLEPGKILRYKKIFEHFQYQKAKVTVLFEMGKNRVKWNQKHSVEAVIDTISQMLGLDISYFTGGSEKDLEYALEEILPGEILFIENLALNEEEEKESSQVFKKIEEWADYYVNDAFGVSARPYYSFTKLPKKKDAYSGVLLMNEITRLAEMFSRMKRPLTLILGGLDIDYFMIDQLLTLSEKVDHVLITGAWVSYYVEELGEIEREEWMDKKVLKTFNKNLSRILSQPNIHFPVDVRVYKKYDDGTFKVANVPIDFIRQGLKIGDVGRVSLSEYAQIIEQSEFVIWLGSVGKWWKEGLEGGTLQLYEAIERKYCDKILVGDDLIESLEGLGCDTKRFSHLHYGDGESVLRFLTSGKIEGVDNLKDPWNI